MLHYHLVNIEHLLQGASQLVGILLVAGIVFAESGLLIGFFLPGDTLLFTAGFFASKGSLPLGWLLIASFLAAIIGDNVGYQIGHRSGKRIFTKKDGIIFRAEYVERAEKFYEAHGGKTITIARFVPIVRTFAPVVAGVGKMDRKKFMFYNIVGAAVWAIGITMLGYVFGNKIPNIDRYILPVVLGASAITFGPAAYHLLKDPVTRQKLLQKLKTLIKR